MYWRKWATIIQALGCLPSGDDSVSSTLAMCRPSSKWRASSRSSTALSRLTRPISRRYMRTGSSIISTLLMSFSHSAGAAVAPESTRDADVPFLEGRSASYTPSDRSGVMSSPVLNPSSVDRVVLIRSAVVETSDTSPRSTSSAPSVLILLFIYATPLSCDSYPVDWLEPCPWPERCMNGNPA